MALERFAVLQWVLAAGVAAWLLYLLGPVLTPFVAAAIFAYIFNPLVDRLCGWKLNRTLAVLLVMVGVVVALVALVLILLPLLQKEANLFAERLPMVLESVRIRWLPRLQQLSGGALPLDAEALRTALSEHWQSAGGVAAKVLPWLSGGGAAIVGWLMNLLLIPLVLFYFLRDWHGFLAAIGQTVPKRWLDSALPIMREIDTVLAEFLRGQISVMALMSLFYVVGLWLVGLQFSLPIGLTAGLLVFVPYLGMITGLGLATLAALGQFEQFTGVLMVWGVFGAGQLLEGMVVTPWLVGERIGLHPLAVIFALLAFGQLFGFFGVLLALPLSAALLVALRHVRQRCLCELEVEEQS